MTLNLLLVFLVVIVAVYIKIMTSSTDIKYILNPDWSKKIALGIAEGICEAFGGTVSLEENETIKPMSADSYDKKYAGTYIATSNDLKLQ